MASVPLSLPGVDVTADSSVEAIEDELEYFNTLLATLDPEAADYASDRRDYENKLHIMESWKARKQPKSTSQNSAPTGSQHMDLPTRDRLAPGASDDRAPANRVSDPNDQRKRGRENTISSAEFHTRKARRLSDSLSSSSVDGDHTSNSSPAQDFEYQRARERKNALDRQRLLEERFRRQKADEQYARSLAQTLQDPEDETYEAFLNRETGQRLSQTMLTANGYRRRSMSPPSRRMESAAQPQTSQESYQSAGQRPQPQIPPLDSATRSGSIAPYNAARTPGLPSYSARPNPYHLPDNGLSTSRANSNGDRQAALPPVGHSSSSHQPNPAGSQRASPGNPLSAYQENLNPYNTTLGQLPNYGSGLTSVPIPRQYLPPGNLSGGLSGTSTHAAPRHMPMPGQSFYNTASQPQSASTRQNFDWLGTVVNSTSSLFENATSSLLAAGNNWSRFGGYISSDDEDNLFGRGTGKGFRYGFDQAEIASRNKEEIELLLQNIRPDEELAEEAQLETPSSLSVTLMKHQRLGLTWLKHQEEGPNKASILADDMGLGKTIQALSLIVSRPSPDRARKTTLIIAPVALMKQWEREIDDKMKPGHKLKVFIYHGAKRVTFAKLSQYDVVLTTLGKVGSELKKKEDLDYKIRANPTYRPTETFCLIGDDCKWWRVIIDEAQSIKNANSRGAKAAQKLDATHRLCMTGTPMMNNIKELWSLIHFLRIKPYNEWEKFRAGIMKPLESRDEDFRGRGMKALQALLKAILLRRTKKSQIDGKPILKDLPDRSTAVDNAVFDQEQHDFYQALEQKVQIQANRYLQPGQRLRNYANVLVLLLRLRQACDHPSLINEFDSADQPSDLSENDMEKLAKDLGRDTVNMIKGANGAFECPICMDAAENPTIFFPCGHDVCAECFTKLLESAGGDDDGTKARCPECRSELHASKILTFTIFKKVHMPDAHMDSLVGHDGAAVNEEEDDDSDDSDDSDDDDDNDAGDDDDVDSQGDLRDFIVNDEEEGEPNADSGDEAAAGEAEESNDEFRPDPGESSAQGARRRRVRGRRDKGKTDKKKKTKTRMTLAELKKQSLKNQAAKKKYLKRLSKAFQPSAKTDKMMEVLREIWANDPTEKVIIFSQFTSFLDLAEVPIYRGHIGYRRYDGSMKPGDRDLAVQEFFRNSEVRLMLISLKSGNAGLNLTCASHVIMLDPFWNPFIEEQAIDRAHRIGQKRHVHVHRILVTDTVEDRIIQLQEKKRQLINEALDEKTSQDMGRLGVRELRYLFGLDRSVPTSDS